ncbi:hypothetical protein B0T26DRAFT_741531 [Lasiosphaeria miniovina]|uniref:Uncharacterized protein n=1 Tax=Lasiosphaeria miniovina TaxID=1954250 RepID=A0AA40AAK1_9PEZI|nr:uncharacterized protein B0T26DRAFT_741531 [Lasiosphaeria miniovina]KAK0712347.1 hypothetical protein B0T26DRAFT_741531 [Lasiosphaeria miniovina]
MRTNGEDADVIAELPPPSQSHFAKFENFAPNDGASFDNEFDLYREPTIAMRQELKLHYFSQSQDGNSETDAGFTEEDLELKGYQKLYREVGIPSNDSIAECKRDLKNALVNIVDLVDAQRLGKKVEAWNDFGAFRDYTLQDEHRIDAREAKKDGGFLASLLQRLRLPGSQQSPTCRPRPHNPRPGLAPWTLLSRL